MDARADPKIEDRNLAIDSCSCPRPQSKSLPAPFCTVELGTGGEHPVIFVNPPPELYCSHLKPFGNGTYCNCERRQYVYSRFGI